MSDQLTLLGCAFASADLLLQTDATGVVRFAAGAAFGGEARLVKRPWRDLVGSEHHASIQQRIDALHPGERSGPHPIELQFEGHPPKRAQASLLTLTGPEHGVYWSIVHHRDAETGVTCAEQFFSATDALFDQELSGGRRAVVTLIDLARAGADVSADRGLLASLHDGRLRGARLGGRRYAVATAGQDPVATLSTVLRLEPQVVQQSAAQFTVGLPTPMIGRLALRKVIDDFAGSPDFSFDQLQAAFASHQVAAQSGVSRLRDKLTRREFRLVYQPIVHLCDGRIHHYEALLRLNGDESPYKAIEFAEEVGLIADLDHTVISTALATLKPAAPEVNVAVNISGRSLTADGFVTELISQSKKSGLAPHRFSIEVTESSKLEDLEAANAQIQRLRRAGVRVALDDFGAGFSSLAYLHQLSVDLVKIDGAYVKTVASSDRTATLVRHMVELCASMGAETVGEMVEDGKTAGVLRGLGVTYGQGWHHGRPVAKLPEPAAAPAAPLRRKGLVESWG